MTEGAKKRYHSFSHHENARRGRLRRHESSENIVATHSLMPPRREYSGDDSYHFNSCLCEPLASQSFRTASTESNSMTSNEEDPAEANQNQNESKDNSIVSAENFPVTPLSCAVTEIVSNLVSAASQERSVDDDNMLSVPMIPMLPSIASSPLPSYSNSSSLGFSVSSSSSSSSSSSCSCSPLSLLSHSTSCACISPLEQSNSVEQQQVHNTISLLVPHPYRNEENRCQKNINNDQKFEESPLPPMDPIECATTTRTNENAQCDNQSKTFNCNNNNDDNRTNSLPIVDGTCKSEVAPSITRFRQNETVQTDASLRPPRRSSQRMSDPATKPRIVHRLTTNSHLYPSTECAKGLEIGVRASSLPNDDNEQQSLSSLSAPPLTSNTIPGAFSAAGRAFGAYPAWSRPNRPNTHNNTVSILRRLSRTLRWTTSTIPHILEATLVLNNNNNNNNNNSRRLSSPSHQPAQSQHQHQHQHYPNNQNERGCPMTSSHDQTTGTRSSQHNNNGSNDEEDNECHQGRVVVVQPDKIVTEEQVRYERRRFWTGAALFAFGLLLIASFVAIPLVMMSILGQRQVIDDSPPVYTYRKQTSIFPSNKTLTHDVVCRESGPRLPLDQCLCTGSLDMIPAYIIDSYDSLNELLSALIPGYHRPRSKTNCADPQNLAMYWLIQSENIFDASELSQWFVQRYFLAVFYFSWGGLHWSSKNNEWLTIDDECTWQGVYCDGQGQLIELHLAGQNLMGQFPTDRSIWQYFGQTDLRLINVSDNPGLVGAIPIAISRAINLRTLDIRGTKIEASSKNDMYLVSAREPGSSSTNEANLEELCNVVPNLSIITGCGQCRCSCCLAICNQA